MSDDPQIAEAIRRFARDPWLAHQVFFPHRHPKASAAFHRELCLDFWSDEPASIRMAFRGAGKSTIAEEDITIAAAAQRWHNILIIGASETRAAERIAPIKFELDHNALLHETYGEQHGEIWTQTKLVTAKNVCVQAVGRDQDIRGLKFLDWRPEFVLVDDFEDPQNVLTPEGRIKVLRRFLAEILPACAPHARVRVRATPMGEDSVPLRLEREAKWPSKTYPIEYEDDEGSRKAAWPEAFPLPWIDEKRRIYTSLGELAVWEREFMCRAVAESDQVFRREQIRVRPRLRTWEATYGMIDPARTVRATSASTGWACWSWIKNRLVVWGGGAGVLLPTEIIALGFDIEEKFGPVWLGVEEDGLNEFLLQPFRQEMARRGVPIPLRPVKAPRGKLDFIKGLQPFFDAGEVEFVEEFPALTEQLLNFPRGRIDAPNALAYALMLRPGAPIYDGFTTEHVYDTIAANRLHPLWLACGSDGGMTTAVVVQHVVDRIVVLADWLLETEPAVAVPLIVRDAGLRFGRALTACCGAQHFDMYRNVGLVQALRRVPMEAERGVAPENGRVLLREEFGKLSRGEPAVQVASAARHTLNALAGGYSRPLRSATLDGDAENGVYKILMEAVECCLGRMVVSRQVESNLNWSYTSDGRRYLRYGQAQSAEAIR